MLVLRWQALTPPSAAQIKLIFESEGHDAIEEVVFKGQKHIEKRHPFCEVRFIVSGELHLSIGGTQFLLRAGDRIEIPANTRHSYWTQNESVLNYYIHLPY